MMPFSSSSSPLDESATAMTYSAGGGTAAASSSSLATSQTEESRNSSGSNPDQEEIEEATSSSNTQAQPKATHRLKEPEADRTWRRAMRDELDVMELASDEFALPTDSTLVSPPLASILEAGTGETTSPMDNNNHNSFANLSSLPPKRSKKKAGGSVKSSASVNSKRSHRTAKSKRVTSVIGTGGVPKESKITDVTLFAKTKAQESSLETCIENVIDSCGVVMFEKTWCLFSRDAKDFLLHQLGVSLLHSVAVDECRDGDAIAAYLQHKTGHATFPAIFVKGQFLGGFDEVNALYSTGQLEREYLKGLTQAQRCEMEVRATKQGTSEPLFWFPHRVDAHVVRMTGVLTCFIALGAAALYTLKCLSLNEFGDGVDDDDATADEFGDWGLYVAAFLWLDFTGRILAGARGSLVGTLATFLIRRVLRWEAKPRVGRPKQFAACCGLMFSVMGTLAGLIVFPYHSGAAAMVMVMLAMATGMEGFLDFCLGCLFFKIGIQLGLIPK